jgi:hypothetical protein
MEPPQLMAKMSPASLNFDGSSLRLQMQHDQATGAAIGSDTPTLTMELVDDQLEGYWTNPNANKPPLTPRLKMVRYQQ